MRKLVGVLGLLVCLVPSPAAAHPMGNFSINTHLGFNFDATAVAATLIVDMAEIPAFQEKEIIDVSGDGRLSAIEISDYAIDACGRHRREVDIFDDGVRLELKSDGARAELLPGAAGLEILRIECGYRLDLADPVAGELTIENRVYLDRIGWREMTAAAVDFALETDLPVTSPSELLTMFPENALQDRSSATIGYSRTPGAGMAAPPRSLVERLGSNLEIGWLGLVVAAGLGVTHALAPGHGKTLMAAYLVGRRGQVRHAVGLGASVAVSHTVGVGILGLLTVVTTSRFQPERIYPWLSVASAGVVTAIGGVMLYRVLRDRSNGHDQQHGHEHGQHGHDHGHDHGHAHGHDHGPHHGHIGDGARPLGWRSLAALGLAGGLVPSASAVVLLLGAVSQGNPWFGLGLVAAFGSGMAVALVAAGLGAVWAFRLGWGFISRDRMRHRLERTIPALAGGSVTVVGLILLAQAARAWS